MAELKPCPFCGGHNVNIYFSGDWKQAYYAECNTCHAKSGYFESPGDAIGAWNRRAGE